MNRLLTPARLVAVAALLLVVGCSHGGRQMMGDPENPYPLKAPPKVGEIVHLPTGILVTPEQMLAVAGDARVVYVGETHDNPASHRLELQVLKGLADLHPGGVALGMEMFVRSQQPALDRWVAGELDEKAFLKESRWYENWHMDYAYYRDLLDFARDRKIPVIALNAEKALVAAMRGKTPGELSYAEQAEMPVLDLDDPYQRGMVTAIFGDHSHGAMQVDAFVRTQTLWDETMAESVTRYLGSPAGKQKKMLVVAGGNHVSYGFGIPRRVFRRLPVSYLLIGGQEINVPADKQNRMMNVTMPGFPMVPFDFLAYFSYEDLPETGVRLGVVVEPVPTSGGLTVKSIMAGSNAERAGLQAGDLLLALDNDPLKESFDLVYAVKRKRAGDHGLLKVERQGQLLTLDVLFTASGEVHPKGSK